MAECYYEPTPATDGATMNPVPGAVFQVFEIADTTFSTPLSLRVGAGNPTTTVTASESLATLPGVYVTSPNFEHIWVSGGFQWRRDSIDGAKAAIQDAKVAAVDAAASSGSSAQSSADSAQAARDAAALVDAPADTVMAGVAGNPDSQFATALNATTAENISTPGNPVYDALSVSLDEVTEPLVDGQSGRLVSTLRRGTSDAVLTILGDSTGNETTEWVYRLAVWLGQEFPAYTVTYRLWSDATQAYGSAQTLQAGTGSRTLSVYNGSHPGASFNYAADPARFPKLVPVAPTTVVVSFGYNSTGTTYRIQQLKVSDYVLSNFPNVEYVLTAQPPKRTVNADAADHLKRQEDTRSLAAQERWGLIDATQPFIDYGAYDELIDVDEIHPNATGRTIWFEEVQKYFGKLAQSQTPNLATAKTDRIVVPASGFVSYFGSPVMGFESGIIMPRWALPDSADTMLACMVDVPPSWASVDVSLLWGSPAGASGAVTWKVDWYNVSGDMRIDSGAGFAGSTAGAPNTQTVAGAMFRRTEVYTSQRFAGGRPLAFRVTRQGAAAADTSTQNALLFGLLIKRAE